jgi:hypothetical protein
MRRVRRLMLALALIFTSALVVMSLRPGAPGPQNAAGPVLLLVRLRRNCKVPVLY